MVLCEVGLSGAGDVFFDAAGGFVVDCIISTGFFPLSGCVVKTVSPLSLTYLYMSACAGAGYRLAVLHIMNDITNGSIDCFIVCSVVLRVLS